MTQHDYRLLSDGTGELHFQQDNFADPWKKTPETVLMHHGFGRSGNFWYPWVPDLARHYRVIRTDARGHGRSVKPAADFPWSLEILVEDACWLLDRLSIDKVHFIGESGGGLIGLLFALRHPDRVASLTLCGGFYRVAQQSQEGLGAGGTDWASAYTKIGVKQWVLSTMHTRVDMDKTDPAFLEWYAEESATTPPYVYAGLVRRVVGTDLYDQLPSIKTPTLLLAPEFSTVAPLPEQRVMARRLPNAKLRVFKGYKHAIMNTIPDRCVKTTLRFLRGVG